MTLEELAEHFRALSGCCLHSPTWTPDDVAEVLFAIQDDGISQWQVGWNGGSDCTVLVAARLKDGQYGLMRSSEDYTGHGCRCSTFTGRYGKLNLLLRDGILPELYG